METSSSDQDEITSQVPKVDADDTTQAMLLALLQNPAIATSTTEQKSTPVQPTVVEAAPITVPTLSTPDDHEATQGSVTPTLSPLPATTQPNTMPALTTAPVAPQDPHPSSNQNPQQLTSQQIASDEIQGQVTDSAQTEQTQPANMVGQAEVNQRRSPAPDIAKDALPPQHDQKGEDIAARLVANQPDTGIHQIQELHEQAPVPSHPLTSVHAVTQGEEAAPKNVPALPHSWEAFSNFDKQPDMQGFDRQESHHDRTDTPLPQGASVPVMNQQVNASVQLATPFAVGNTIQPMPRSLDTHSSLPVTPAQTMAVAHDTSDVAMPGLSRSVVFEVAHPDLGRINVRVGITNDLVHTHLSSDRPDVGNFLMNGQDRLQSALQASGLEMGQFRVQVDRQGTTQGGQEWLAREYDNRSQQQRGNQSQQDQSNDSPRNDRQQLGMLSVFA